MRSVPEDIKVYHVYKGCNVYDHRGQLLCPDYIPPTARLTTPADFYDTRSPMMFVAGHGRFRPETAARHLAVGRHVFDGADVPLRPVPAGTLIGGDTRVAPDTRDSWQLPGGAIWSRPERSTVDQASRGVQNQLAQVEPGLAEGSFQPTSMMLLETNLWSRFSSSK